MDWVDGGTGGSTGSSTGSKSFWSMNNPALWLMASFGLSLYNSWKQYDLSNEAIDKQEKAQAAAEAKQTEADYNAEQKRLAALAKNQQAQGFDFGVDSALAKRYADAAQKWAAGTGSMTEDEDENNPFYTKGLI